MKLVRFFTVLFVISSFLAIGDALANVPADEKRLEIQEAYGKIPLHFIKNNGQIDEKVYFYEKGAGHSVYFTKEGIYLVLSKKDVKSKEDVLNKASGKKSSERLTTEYIIIKPLNTTKSFAISAEKDLQGRVNYLTTKDPASWKTDIPTYSKVMYKGIYEGIDMVFYGNQRQLEYDVVVGADKDYRPVSFLIEGANDVRKAKDGGLEIVLNSGDVIIQKSPHIYQEIDGRKVDVEGRFEISKEKTGYIFSFNVGDYDKKSPLIIDPIILSYSTYLGGTILDTAQGIAIDANGNAYVTGWTDSFDFPTENAYQLNQIVYDAFVTKLNPQGNGLVYSTYLGGSADDYAYAIAVNANGNAYVTGVTRSVDFPIKNAYDKTCGTDSYCDYKTDAFVTKLNPQGNGLVYSTYLGGSADDYAYAIAVNASGNAYVTGVTYSVDLPIKNAYDKTCGTDSYCDYKTDAFVTKLNPQGNGLVYSTYLGGSADDVTNGISIDADGNAYVAGYTYSADYPTKNAYQGSRAQFINAFVTKLNPQGNDLVYSTYLGGSADDVANGIAVDASGNAYVVGYTYSIDFPIESAFQALKVGSVNTFVTKLNPQGNGLIYSTYLGGSYSDVANAIAVDADGNAYVTGEAYSMNFPTTPNPYQASKKGYYYNAFVTKLPSSFTITVEKRGSGSGTVTSNKGGIDCKPDCVEAYPSGTTVELTATPDVNSTFTGWSGDADCLDGVVTLDANRFCTAIFNIPSPTNLTAKATSSSSIVLGWQDNSINEQGFKIEMKSGNCSSTNKWSVIATLGSDITTYVSKNLSPNSQYSYRVRAYNAKGSSVYSDCVNAKTGIAGTPSSPTRLQAASISQNTIHLTWKDNSSIETGFKIYRKVGSNTWVLLKTVAANTTSYSDTTATGNDSTGYSYYVKACNSAGCSPLTSVAEIPYSYPTNIIATGGIGKIALTWTDNSSNETGVRLLRKDGSCSAGGAWSLLSNLEQNKTNYIDSGLTSGQTYSYKVKAYKRSNEMPFAFGFSMLSDCAEAVAQ